ncbi:efflux RND transporter permease subunit [Zymomonas mobilis]|uniref:Efflux pump membrane transporter n=1 Tax=Zymomonas mobilis subsp. pomaceae (strain ATCC 29192 / DSM 22645 / JCM 10191 / CCUG 17912 / NBRC 13757 / NCIMB 11200 / NRRL B-4491 / Barker I) TaxID=579138 RepID=F8ESM3_ZYMMT|nr:efflux RND transporter permease subunit [Zymomonas mobilis]AEI37798.1 transporter, hydrophobe/amphiphile efflux-1 (HAE1) family [Zymomonas mobilis subsp. pomaceae ATCC 29192]MDX5949165.1 efflux RND transporter permease subunit [Zymomonas mobilis subsp. pomaceae]GEB89801.1 multidrug resistance protein MexB [Zymomonas mobilis subsp. pomaceae]
MARYFIDRPIFAWVVGLIIMLLGGLSILRMPIAQYPTVAPPQIEIGVFYPGASAETINNTVVRPILQQMHGLDNLEYISASSFASGQMTIDLTFAQGTDADIAQVQVQNKLQLAQPRLPSDVVNQGITVNRSAKSFMMIMSFISTDGSMSFQDINDYVASNIADPLSRVSGIGDYTLFGSEYAMRIWLDPDKLYKYNLTITDVQSAIATQNIQLSSGELGGLPAVKGTRLDATIIGPTRLTSAEEFKNILIKAQPTGAQIRLGDIAKVELGAQNYSFDIRYDNQPASGIAVKLAPGANQLQTENLIRKRLADLEPFFPHGLKIEYPVDTKPFITASIHEVIETLLEAIALVFFVMLIFLQNFRATLIPTIAVPVVLLGTFGVLSVLGYSINTLTMLAMVLAVGLLVDDAIVVVENVERLMTDEKLSPKEAAKRSMDEISGALIGIVLVLSAVFLPMAAFSGSTGVIYRQFSITIVVAMGLSVLVAMIMTPALCATMLKPINPEKEHRRSGFIGRLADGFNRGFDRLNNGYLGGVSWLLGRSVKGVVAFLLIVVGVVFLFSRLPTGFLPDEDQGEFIGQVTMPPGSSQEQTAEAVKKVTNYLMKAEKDSVLSILTVSGFNFGGQGQNAGSFFVRLKPWDERPKASQGASAIALRTMMHFANDPSGMYFAFNMPAVRDLGNATGFDLELEDRGHIGHEKFLAARNMLLGMASKDPRLSAVRPNGMEDAPQYHLTVDYGKATTMGLSPNDVNIALQGSLGSIYVNQFMRDDRVKQVYIMGAPEARMLPSDLSKWYLRNNIGTMVPFSTFMSGEWQTGPQKVENYNGYNAFEIMGTAASGHSSGESIQAMTEILHKLPEGVGYEWTGLSFEEQAAGSSTASLYALSAIVVLFCLAALYESWAIPISVILVLPLGVLGAVVATLMRGLSNDVYFQIGLLTTVGLTVKNAILIVEFAKAFFDDGIPLGKAVMQAGRERLRPILMTSIAFVLGVIPLSIATGASSAARIAIGTAVVGGMLTATLLTIFFVPLFFVLVLKLFRVKPNNIEKKAAI